MNEGRVQFLQRAVQAGAIVLVLAVAASLRWYGLAWDQGYLFHPDERQILVVASSLEWPHSLGEVLSPSSTLNPHFFAYGSFPIYLLRLLSLLAPPSDLTGPWANDFLARWILFGRAVSGLFDLGTIGLVYWLGRKMYDARVGLVAAAGLAVTALSIQLAHFYTVDTLLSLLVLVTLCCAYQLAETGSVQRADQTRFWKLATGISFGLALATKVSALPLILPIALAIWRESEARLPGGRLSRVLLSLWRVLSIPLAQVVAIAIAVFIITQPYALIDGYNYGAAVVREGLAARGLLDFPYTRQYADTTPYLYQVVQVTIWGTGIPLGVLAWLGGIFFVARALRWREWRDVFLMSWAIIYFLVVGGQYVKFLRYLLPLLPILYLMAARSFLDLQLPRFVRPVAFVLVAMGSLLYCISFVSMYGREHPWLTASRWTLQHIRPGSTIVVEQWDDHLPVQQEVDGVRRDASEYRTIEVPIQDLDDSGKLVRLVAALENADVVILASPRAYASLPRLQDRFPLTARYYQKLFDGSLGFRLAAAFSNDPQLFGLQISNDPNVGLRFRAPAVLNAGAITYWSWGRADESVYVYDHPQPLIFVKDRSIGATELRLSLSGF